MTGQGRVGVEIELGGLDVDATARVVARVLGGAIRATSTYERVVDTPSGPYRIELDSSPLKRWGARQDPSAMTELVEQVATEVVPCEVVTPPLAREELPRLDDLVLALGAAGGRGTFDALRFGFGVHFNAELLERSTDTILARMRAFALLYPSLVTRYHVDPTRRIGVFIDPWPGAYVARILDPTYAPDATALIDDYVREVGSRDHALDMLPMLAHLDEARVRAALPDEKIHPRPAFHYRLCNSRVGNPAWRVTQEWRSWREVEALAADPARLIARIREGAQAPGTLDMVQDVAREVARRLGQ